MLFIDNLGYTHNITRRFHLINANSYLSNDMGRDECQAAIMYAAQGGKHACVQLCYISICSGHW